MPTKFFGKISIILAILTIVCLIGGFPLILIADTASGSLDLGELMLGLIPILGISAFIFGILSIKKTKEKPIFVILATGLGSIILILCVIAIISNILYRQNRF